VLPAARRAGLEGVEKSFARVPHHRIAGRAGYRFRLLVALVVVAAVQGKLLDLDCWPMRAWGRR
jgi:hypothetical protein